MRQHRTAEVHLAIISARPPPDAEVRCQVALAACGLTLRRFELRSKLELEPSLKFKLVGWGDHELAMRRER